MSVAPEYHAGWAAGPPDSLSALLGTAGAAVDQLADGADMTAMTDSDAAPVMDTLTTMIARLDRLRVDVARTVADRELYSRCGVRNLTGWLRADPRLADDAWKIYRLATMAPRLPKVAGLLAEGRVSLSQAGTACWQISRLPDLPRQPDAIDETDGSARAGDGPGSDTPGDAWAGLWRTGDVQAAADELFSTFLPRLDGDQIRVMGAHLREAADTQERASQDYNDFRRRGLRISRSLGGAGEISGRLHAEAAEQVIAAFERLGVKTGPDDDRTKAQRWADVLTGLTATAPDIPSPGQHASEGAASDPGPEDATPGDDPEGTAREGGPEGAVSDPGPEDAVGGGGPEAAEAGDDDQPHEHHGHDHGHDHGMARQRPRVIVTVPLPVLLGWPLSTGGMLGSGTPLSAEAIRRLACDAEIVRVVTAAGCGPGPGPDGSPTAQLTELMAAAIAQLPPPLGGPSAVLDVGRKSPGWTPRQRDALHAQYGGHCAFPRCTGPIDVIHHVIHWIHGGRTKLANGAPLCSYHHWLAHEGGWRVTKHRDGRISVCPPPPGWRPGTIYRCGKPVREGPVPPSG